MRLNRIYRQHLFGTNGRIYRIRLDMYQILFPIPLERFQRSWVRRIQIQFRDNRIIAIQCLKYQD